MLKYFFSLIFIFLFVFHTSGQDRMKSIINSQPAPPPSDEPEDSIPVEIQAPVKPAIYLGFDLARPIMAYFSPEQHNYEVTADFRLNRKILFSADAGSTKIAINDTSYKYNSSGQYFRFGVNFNLLKLPSTWNKGLWTIGVKYGFSTLTHNSPSFYIRDDYWGNYTGSMPESTIKSNWIELSSSLRTEIFKNFYLGWTVRFNFLLGTNSTNAIKPYYIPGYGKGTSTTFPLVNYYVYYMIPL